MAFGVTEEGFVLKRLEDILSDQRAKAAEIFQDLVTPGDVVDTTDSSALGRLINLDSEGDAELWEVAQQIYSSYDPNTATGIALDNIVAFGGLFRTPETHSIATVLLEGDRNTSIPNNSVVRSPTTSSRFNLTSAVTLDLVGTAGVDIEVVTVSNETLYTITYSSSSTGAETVDYTTDTDATESEILNGLHSEIVSSHPGLESEVVGSTLQIRVSDIFDQTGFSFTGNLFAPKVVKTASVRAEEAGPIEAVENSITQIVSSVLGWDSVINPLAAVKGRLLETDEELRLRFENTKFTRGINTLDSLVSDLGDVEGVTDVRVYENDTDAVDANGLPPHSFRPIIVGGAQDVIADTIWKNKPPGIGTSGGVSVIIQDSQAQPHTVKFSRPTLIPIYVSITVTKFADYPQDGNDQIKKAIIEYAEEFFNVTDDVILTRLYTPINSVPGHQVDSLQIGLSELALDTENIPIAFDEISSFVLANITVEP